MSNDESHAPPPGLDGRGLGLWQRSVAELEFDADELVVLEQACRLVNEVDALSAALAEAGPVVMGSRQQPVANPLIREVRAHRLALARLMRQLAAGIPVEGSGERETPSQRGRRAAITRWHGARATSRPEVAAPSVLDDYRRAFEGAS